jgi:type IV secretion system protein VirB9
MHSTSLTLTAVCLICWGSAAPAQTLGAKADPRLREIRFDVNAVVTVPVKRGVVTLVVLDPTEAIAEVGSGLGADCSKPEASWCIAAQPGGHHLFVKPKSAAGAANNLAVVTNKRTHAFRFVVLPDGDARQPVYRLVVKVEERQVPRARMADQSEAQALTPAMPAIAEVVAPSPAQLVAERLAAAPSLVNANYSVAEGENSEDILPALIFDDGRFTYFRFPNNREVPAVFHVLGDGSETLVNTRMEGDLLVVDRVSRRLMLRAGLAVVGVWNESFDIDGVPPREGTTVAGVRRVLKADGRQKADWPMPRRPQ